MRPAKLLVRARSIVLTAMVLGGLVATTRAASAQSAAPACTSEFVAFQEQQKAGELRRARATALQCASDACPDSIRKVCIQAVDDINHDTPTIVIRALGPDGCDVTGAKVLVDDVPLEGPLDGKALPIDPGSRRISVEIPGKPASVRSLLVAQGEKNRSVLVDFSGGAVCGQAPAAAPASPPSSAASRPTEEAAPMTTPTIVFGVVGLAALGGAAGFGISSIVRRSDICDDTGCDPAEIDGVRTTFIVGDVLLATGVVSLGIATILHLTRPDVTETETVSLAIGGTPGGARASIRGEF